MEYMAKNSWFTGESVDKKTNKKGNYLNKSKFLKNIFSSWSEMFLCFFPFYISFWTECFLGFAFFSNKQKQNIFLCTLQLIKKKKKKITNKDQILNY